MESVGKLWCGWVHGWVVLVGWPKFDQEYARKIFFDYRFHYAIVATTMLISHPFVLVMLPLSKFGLLLIICE